MNNHWLRIGTNPEQLKIKYDRQYQFYVYLFICEKNSIIYTIKKL